MSVAPVTRVYVVVQAAKIDFANLLSAPRPHLEAYAQELDAARIAGSSETAWYTEVPVHPAGSVTREDAQEMSE
jgi:hypothetical protein